MKTRLDFFPALLLCGAFLCGCGGSDKGDDAAEREGVFDPLTNTLEEAEQVEDLVLQQKQQMDDALRRMEGEEDEPER